MMSAAGTMIFFLIVLNGTHLPVLKNYYLLLGYVKLFYLTYSLLKVAILPYPVGVSPVSAAAAMGRYRVSFAVDPGPRRGRQQNRPSDRMVRAAPDVAVSHPARSSGNASKAGT